LCCDASIDISDSSNTPACRPLSRRRRMVGSESLPSRSATSHEQPVTPERVLSDDFKKSWLDGLPGGVDNAWVTCERDG
jgi:hypothetical protein